MPSPLRTARARGGPLLAVALVALLGVGSTALAALPDRGTDTPTTALVVAPVVVLGLLLLGRRLAGLRADELRLLRVRGVGRLRLARRALAGPALAVVAGGGAGVALALGAAELAPEDWVGAPQPGPRLAVAAGVAAATCLLATAAGLAAGLRAPVAAHVTGQPPRRAPSSAPLVVGVALAVLVVLVAVRAVRDDAAAWEVWLGPPLLGLVAGQAAAWLLPRVATGASRLADDLGVETWLALRHAGRSASAAAAVRVVVAAAVGLGFALTATASVDDWVDEGARVVNGAAHRFALDGSAAEALTLTQRLDPQGRHLTAAAVFATADDEVTAYVDAERYARAAGGLLDGTSAASVAEEATDLAASASPWLTTGAALEVRGRADGLPSTTISAVVDYVSGDNVVTTARARVRTGGGARFALTVPLEACERGCVLQRLALRADRVVFPIVRAVVAGEVDVLGGGGWSAPAGAFREAGRGGGAYVDLTPHRDAAFVPELPLDDAPVVAASSTRQDVAPGIEGDDRAVDVVAEADALPLVGGRGLLADLRGALPRGPTAARVEVLVLAGADTPAAVLAELEGVAGPGRSVAQADDALGGSAGRTDVRLLLLLSVVGLAVAVVAAAGAAGGERGQRRRDRTHLAGVGLTAAAHARASRREVLLTVLAAAAATVAGTWVAVALLLDDLPLTGLGHDLPDWDASVRALPLLSATAAAAVVGLAVRRLATPDRARASGGPRRGAGSGSIVLRGVRARGWLSAGAVVLTALAVAAAVLGPVYARSVTESYLVSRLDQAPLPLTTLSWDYTPGPAVPAATDAAAAAAGELGLRVEPPYGAPTVQLESTRYPHEVVSDGTRTTVELGLLAREGACEQLAVTGRCPESAGEALVLADDLAVLAIEVGDTVTGPAGVGRLTVVGTYRPPEPDDDFWVDPYRFTSFPPQLLEGNSGMLGPARPAPLVVPPETFDRLGPTAWVARLDSRLEVSADLSAGDVRAAAAQAGRLQELAEGLAGGNVEGRPVGDLSAIADEIADQRRTASASIMPALVALVLVALALLLRLLTASGDRRAPELALAALRGTQGRRLWALGLAEPLLAVAVAVPLGVALGLGSARLLADAWLEPGTGTPLGGRAVLAAAAVVVAAVAVIVVTVGRLVRLPLADQLGGVRRPESGARRRLLVGVLLAVVAALLAARIGQGRTDEPQLADLLLPVAIAVVVGSLTTWLAVLVAGRLARARLLDRWLAAFVSVRSVARRQENTLVVLPLTAALAIGVFATAVDGAAGRWRESVAATNAPAAQVFESPLDSLATRDVARRADPDGRWLMPVSVVSYPDRPKLVLVESARLDRVARWPDQWTPGRSASDVAAALGGTEPPLLRGQELTVSVDARPAGDEPVHVTMRLHPLGGEVESLTVGPFAAGTTTRTVRVPWCGDSCELEVLALSGPGGFPRRIEGTFTVDLEVDGVPFSLTGAERWARDDGSGGPGPVTDATTTDGAVTLEVRPTDAVVLAAVRALDEPEQVPVLVGDDAGTVGDRIELDHGDDVAVVARGEAHSLPLAGPHALMADLRLFTSVETVTDETARSYVLGDDVPGDVAARLTQAGLVPVEGYAEEQHAQDTSAYALALRLYAVVAVVVLVLALAGLLMSTAVQLPSRRRDAASLRVVGVRRRVIMAAVAGEQAVVLLAAALAGLVSGVVAAQVLLRTVTLGIDAGDSTPAVTTDVDVPLLLLQAGGAVLVLLVVAVVGALLTVRGARGATLREDAR